MKNYKIYTEGNYFYIIDTITAKVYEAHKKNVLVVKDTKDKTIFRFKNVEGFKDTESVKLQNIQKESGATYTASEFETFYKENTGNFSTPGAPGASAYQVWLDEGNTGTEQEFIDSLKGEKGDRGDMPLTEIDAYLGNFYDPSIVALNRRGINDSAEIVRSLRYVQDDMINLPYTPLLIMSPSFIAENKIYSVIPDDGSGDFTFSRNSSATYIEGGVIKTALPNVPRIQNEMLLTEPQSTNIYLNSEILTTQNTSVTAGTYTASFYGTGTITFSGAFSGTLVGNGIDRVELTFTAIAGVLTSTISGDVLNSQLEQRVSATSYIPTGTEIATRLKDDIKVTGLGPINDNFTIFFEKKIKAYSSNINYFFEFNEDFSANDNFFRIDLHNNFRYQLVSRGQAGTIRTGYFGTVLIEGMTKAAIRVEGLDVSFFVNGVLTDTQTNNNIIKNLNSLNLGSARGGVNHPNEFKQFSIYDTALTDEELITMTG